MSFALSALYLVPKYRIINNLAGSEDSIEQLTYKEHDTLLTNIMVSKYRFQNEGAYPSAQYLTETLSAHYPLFYEEIKVKNKDDDPAKTAWPKIKELHIWPNYSCTETGLFKEWYTASDDKYEDMFKTDPGRFATVSSNHPIDVAANRASTYSCGNGLLFSD